MLFKNSVNDSLNFQNYSSKNTCSKEKQHIYYWFRIFDIIWYNYVSEESLNTLAFIKLWYSRKLISFLILILVRNSLEKLRILEYCMLGFYWTFLKIQIITTLFSIFLYLSFFLFWTKLRVDGQKSIILYPIYKPKSFKKYFQ